MAIMISEREEFRFYNGVVIYPLFFVLLIWTVFWLEIRFGLDFTSWGVKPRSLSGLKGIIVSPFIHANVRHLWHNSIPLLVLTMALCYFYKSIKWKVLLSIVLLSGLGTWVIGRPSYHIGISGVIYGLVAFLFLKGIVARHFRLIALSLLVVFLYGSLIWGTLPLKDEISWEGHLSGFLSGIFLALRFRESIPKPKTFIWQEVDYLEEEDPFMRQFDENGNFFEIENLKDDEAESRIDNERDN